MDQRGSEESEMSLIKSVKIRNRKYRAQYHPISEMQALLTPSMLSTRKTFGAGSFLVFAVLGIVAGAVVAALFYLAAVLTSSYDQYGSRWTLYY